MALGMSNRHGFSMVYEDTFKVMRYMHNSRDELPSAPSITSHSRYPHSKNQVMVIPRQTFYGCLHIFLISMTEQMKCCRNSPTESSTQHFTGCVIWRLSACTCMPHSESNSMGVLLYANHCGPWCTQWLYHHIVINRASYVQCWDPKLVKKIGFVRTGSQTIDPCPRSSTLSTRLSLHHGCHFCFC